MLAEKLASNGAATSGSPIVPDAEDQTMLRNIAAFDGSEVQFMNLQGQSITVDVNDPSLGVITKFRLKDPGGSASKAISNYLIPLLAVIGLGAYFLKDRFLKKREGAGA